MTREQAILIARECASAQPESYYNGPNFEPHEWVITAIMTAGARYNVVEMAPPTTFEMAEEPEDVRTHVLNMRDFFLTLVTGYNTVGAYETAADAQKMAVALNAFEDHHNITGLSWPLEVIREEGSSPGLKTNHENDSPRYGEDL